MNGCLRTRVCKQPIIALYFESKTVLRFYNLEALSQICSLTVAKVRKILPFNFRWKNISWSHLMKFIKCSNEDWTSKWDFGTHHILAKPTINCPCWGLILVYIHIKCIQTEKVLVSETKHLHGVVWAFIYWTCDKDQNQMCWLIWFILCVTILTDFKNATLG